MATNTSAARPLGRRPRRGRLLVTAALVTPLLAACGTGFQAQTNQIYQPGPGISVRDTGVFIINALIVTDGKGNGTLVAALINQQPQPDVLTGVSVTAPSGPAIKTTIISGTVALLPQRTVQFADTGDVRVEGTLNAGADYSITFTFKNAAPIALTIPVVGTSSIYDKVPLGPVPPPTTPTHSP